MGIAGMEMMNEKEMIKMMMEEIKIQRVAIRLLSTGEITAWENVTNDQIRKLENMIGKRIAIRNGRICIAD